MGQHSSCLDELLEIRPHVGKANEEQCKLLLHDFFLKETRWLHALNALNPWYCVDLTACISPQILSKEAERRFHESLFSTSSHETKACLNYLRWEKLKRNRAHLIADFGLPDPYEPLIGFFRAAGEFSVEQHLAEIAVVDNGVYRRFDSLDLGMMRHRFQP